MLFSSDINECELDSDDCDENAECSDSIGSFGCSCNFGYMGSGRDCCKLRLLLSDICLFSVIIQPVRMVKFV